MTMIGDRVLKIPPPPPSGVFVKRGRTPAQPRPPQPRGAAQTRPEKGWC